MGVQKYKGYIFWVCILAVLLSTEAAAQTADNKLNTEFNPEISTTPSSHIHLYPRADKGYQSNPSGLLQNPSFGQALAATNAGESANPETASLTVGYIADEFNVESENGSYRFRFHGEASGLMLASKSYSLMLSYGTAGAQENDGDIRSITADLNLGGNISIFRTFFGLPISGFIPIRTKLGYWNLKLFDRPNSDLNSTVHLGMGSHGAGLGAEVRLPRGLPVLKDNVTAFPHIVKSVGGLRDFTPAENNLQSEGKALSGTRLTRSTDFAFEAKFEQLLGNTGVTAGLPSGGCSGPTKRLRMPNRYWM
ncbi:hypothetical protein SAMN05443144_13717 [Fodinibius roseus]|uniref:MetA-pathway of phenol degradation n=1 Tax=Fodinibius roseus TaxID=1194090 RepID=A0A1M5L5R5_9BACT|nr:hypothetical protein [Fodinibius roseus]SHG59753.1 hypothetical protein SAMN05443144_13717 [Fodinibius roseus]